MFTDFMEPLAIDHTGLLAYLGRILRARGARVYWSRSSIVVEVDDASSIPEYRRLVQTHNRESTGAHVVVTEHDATSFYVTRADS